MAYRSSSTANGSSTAITGIAPTGITVGDRLYAYIVVDTEITNVSPPAFGGWKRIVSAHVPNTGTRNGLTSELWEVKSATGSELYTFTASATGNWIIQCVCFSGRSNSEPVITSFDITSTATASPLSIVSSGLTATAGADLALFAGLDENTSGDTWSFAAPASWTERQDAPGTDYTAATIDTLDNVSAGATGSLTITATRTVGSGNANYSVICLSVPQLTDATITTQPTNTLVIEGNTVTFSVSATGTGGLSYQWQSSINGIDGWSNVSGATSSTLSFTATKTDKNNYYRVIVTSTLDSITSNAVKLDVLLLVYCKQSYNTKRRSNIFDLSGQGWFDSLLISNGIFDKDIATLSTTSDVTVAISGIQTNSSIGNTSVNNNNVLLSGQQVTSNIGNVELSNSINVTEEPINSIQGTVTASTSNSVTVNVTGQQINLSSGNTIYTVLIDTSGLQSIQGQGTVISNTVVNPLGQQEALNQGQLTSINNVIVTGQQEVLNVGQSISNNTIAITGQQAIVFQGDVSKTILINSLGQQVLILQNSLVTALQANITGQESSLNQGIINTAFQLNSIGQEIVASQGSVSTSIGTNDISVTIVGQEISCNSGIIGIISSVFPTGIITSNVIGNTTSNIDINTLGDTINNNLGIFIPSTNSMLIGQNISSEQGNLLTNTSITVAGQNVNVIQTNVQPTNTIDLVGSGMSIQQGSISISLGNDIYINVVGQEIGLSIGTLLPSIDKQITGQEFIITPGVTFSSVNVATSTNQLTFTQGSQSVNVSLNGLGQTLSSHQGTLTLNLVSMLQERGYKILPENRLFIINLENRLYTILPEDRGYKI